MEIYELTYLISPNLSSEEINSLQAKVAGFIQEKQGVLTNTLPVVKKELAYPIKKHLTASMATVIFQANPEEIERIEKKIKTEQEILRYIILNKIPVKNVSVKRKPLLQPLTEEAKKTKIEKIDKKLEEILK